MVDGAGHVGQQLRIAVGVARHQRTDLEARRLLGPGPENGPAFEVGAVGIAVEREEVIPRESDVDADVLAAANGVSDIAVMRGLLGLQLHTDADGEIRAHERGHVTTVGSARVEHSAEEVDQRARLVALYRVARILHDMGRTEMLCTPD